MIQTVEKNNDNDLVLKYISQTTSSRLPIAFNEMVRIEVYCSLHQIYQQTVMLRVLHLNRLMNSTQLVSYMI